MSLHRESPSPSPTKAITQRIHEQIVEPSDPTPQFKTRRQTLSYLYRNHGLRPWFGMLRRMAWWAITGRPAILRPGTAITFYTAPAEFIAMAKDAGLELVRYWQHEDPNTRNNYLFRKAA